MVPTFCCCCRLFIFWSFVALFEITKSSFLHTYFPSIVGSETKEDIPKDETINVFSVASGHLYERFLR